MKSILWNLFWVMFCLFFAAREFNVSPLGLILLAIAVLFIARVIYLDYQRNN